MRDNINIYAANVTYNIKYELWYEKRDYENKRKRAKYYYGPFPIKQKNCKN